MSRPIPSNFHSPRKRPSDRPRSARWVKRAGIRLGAALLIFALCYVGVRWAPGVKTAAEPFLRNILSCSCDFEEAVRCFSAQMEQGGSVQDALEDFCVTAFAVQPTGTATSLQGDYSPFLNALRWSQAQ